MTVMPPSDGRFRTSLTDPLRIDEVDIPGCDGRLGLTLCPGKLAPSAHGAPWARNVALDFEVIRAWGASAVVTLLETAELADLSVAGRLGPAARAIGVDWYHLPIRDGGVPSAAFEQRWTWAGLRLRQLLRAGRRVLIHCKGGQGRAGTLAARLLAELGVPAADALTQVRARRDGAIENARQERHVLYTRPISAAEDAWRSRVAGCLLGGALGDALGYRVEFDSVQAILDGHGPAGVSDPRTGDKAIVSDDTQMTLFTLEGLLRAAGEGQPLRAAMERAYLDWHDTQQAEGAATVALPTRLRDFAVLHARRAPGITCLNALAALAAGRTGNARNHSKGCGSVMRAAPFGCWPRETTPAQAFARAADCAAITHAHPTALDAAGALAHLVAALVAGRTLAQALDALAAVLETGSETARALVLARELAEGDGLAELPLSCRAKLIDRLCVDTSATTNSRGWVAEEALAVAVFASLAGRDAMDALRIAANHAGDSDSTAAVCGNLVGALGGIEALDLHDLTALDVLPAMEWLLARLFSQTLTVAGIASIEVPGWTAESPE
jgi:ADP-ribosyl-[dinitrogen reductase] hydrolase